MSRYSVVQGYHVISLAHCIQIRSGERCMILQASLTIFSPPLEVFGLGATYLLSSILRIGSRVLVSVNYDANASFVVTHGNDPRTWNQQIWVIPDSHHKPRFEAIRFAILSMIWNRHATTLCVICSSIFYDATWTCMEETNATLSLVSLLAIAEVEMDGVFMGCVWLRVFGAWGRYCLGFDVQLYKRRIHWRCLVTKRGRQWNQAMLSFFDWSLLAEGNLSYESCASRRYNENKQS